VSAPEVEPSATDRVLGATTAGGKAIRGGAIRVVGYGVGMVLTAATSIALLRYLGVDDFGRYATVTAIVAIVGGVTDAGLNVIGQREYVLRRTLEEQRALIADVAGIRLLLTPVGVGLAALFAIVAGYDEQMVAGTLFAGSGLVLANLAVSYMLPLSSTLRLGWVTAGDVARQSAIMAVILALVVAGASLAPLFVAHVAGGAATLAVTLVALRGSTLSRPAFGWARWRPLVVAAAPIALSLVLNVVYLRALLVMSSLIATEAETGRFAASMRVLEVFLGVPILMVGAAFPILVHAQADDEARMTYAMQRLVEASAFVSAALVLVLAVGAEPIMVVLGGEEFRGSADVLRLQSFMLLPAFLTQVWAFALVSINRQRSIVAINAVALASVLVLGGVLIPAAGDIGAAAAAVAGESVLALTSLLLLLRARPGLRPELGRLWRLAGAAGVAALVALVPGLPAAAAAVLALALFVTLALALRAVPQELLEALRRA
jgi:O-antigen/teichoic acid export membrane protein